MSTSLGIEFGSTRIKAILTDENGTIIAEGSHTWENELIEQGGYFAELVERQRLETKE